jgi:HAD superfamily hydrolase (TIGR01509 family)
MKAVIFDMDGVLIDTEHLSDLHMVGFLKKLGINVSLDYLQKFRGTHAKYIWSHIIKDFNLTMPIDELIANVRVSYLKYLTSLDLKPIAGVTPFLKKLKKENYILAVSSSAYYKRINMLLKVCKLKDFFDVIVSGDHVKHSKPDPEIYYKTAQLLKRHPKDCIVFEDATNGILAAKAAGMKVIGYKGADHNKQDLSQADKIINTFIDFTPSSLHDIRFDFS